MVSVLVCRCVEGYVVVGLCVGVEEEMNSILFSEHKIMINNFVMKRIFQLKKNSIISKCHEGSRPFRP